MQLQTAPRESPLQRVCHLGGKGMHRMISVTHTVNVCGLITSRFPLDLQADQVPASLQFRAGQPGGQKVKAYDACTLFSDGSRNLLLDG